MTNLNKPTYRSEKVRLTTADWNNEWRATTMGQFISLLVDDADQAVLYRIVHESEDDEQHGAYRQTLEVITLPQGQVIDAINEKVPIGIHPV